MLRILFCQLRTSTFISRKMINVLLEIVVPSAWEALDITLNGSLNLLYVTLIMMIKWPRIIGSGTYLAHITFSLSTQSQTQYTSRQSPHWWHMRGHLYMGERLGGGVIDLLLVCQWANTLWSDDKKSLLGMNWSLGRSDKIIYSK